MGVLATCKFMIINLVGKGSFTSFEACSSDFRYYRERRHSLALQYLTQRARKRLMRCSEQQTSPTLRDTPSLAPAQAGCRADCTPSDIRS